MSYLLRSTLLACACLLAACAESPENADPEARNEQTSSDGGSAPKKDAGRDAKAANNNGDDDDEGDDDTPVASKDAGIKRDASTPTTSRDASTPSTSKDAGGTAANPLDDLLGGIIDILNPPADAGTSKRDGG